MPRGGGSDYAERGTPFFLRLSSVAPGNTYGIPDALLVASSSHRAKALFSGVQGARHDR